MDINDKLHEFEVSLEEFTDRDYKQIELDIEKEIKLAIEQELSEYEAKKQANYDKNVQKIEKEYNKKIYNYEITCKKEIIDEEKRLKNNTKNDVIKMLKDFTQSEDYKKYLENCIREGLTRIENTQNTYVGLTRCDLDKYENLVKQNFYINLKEINEKFIGGCTLENEEQGIFIDNTILNSINERLDFEV